MIALIDFGRGNLRSVQKALAAAGGDVVRTGDPDVVRRADRLVVPGQGAFAEGMTALRAAGLDEAIREVVAAGRPYLGICLGLQFLFDESDEHGPVPGLGIVRGRVERIAAQPGLKVPHIGWNRVEQVKPDPLVGDLAAAEPGDDYFYFVHSYVAVPADHDCVVLRADYGGELVAAIRVDNVFACQFHPEKSQAAGLALLERFVAGDAP